MRIIDPHLHVDRMKGKEVETISIAGVEAEFFQLLISSLDGLLRDTSEEPRHCAQIPPLPRAFG